MQKFIKELELICKKYEVSIIGDNILFDKDGNVIPIDIEIIVDQK